MYHFGCYPYQIPMVVWNPFYVNPQQTLQFEGGETLIYGSSNSITLISSEGPSKNHKLSNEQKLSLIVPKLKELHKGSTVNKKTHWGEDEDQLLEKLVQKEKMEWKEIPKFFEGRTLSMCYSRYRRIMMNTKEGWKKQDDQLIITMVTNIGQRWKQISLEIPKFTPKQIRQRYLNYLRPNIDKSEFSFDQDYKICQLVLQQGKHWRKFEEELPGRTQGSIKSRFYSKLKNLIQNI